MIRWNFVTRTIFASSFLTTETIVTTKIVADSVVRGFRVPKVFCDSFLAKVLSKCVPVRPSLQSTPAKKSKV
jgi:hypothetical protein